MQYITNRRTECIVVTWKWTFEWYCYINIFQWGACIFNKPIQPRLELKNCREIYIYVRTYVEERKQRILTKFIFTLPTSGQV